jgi:hypothetical protein
MHYRYETYTYPAVFINNIPVPQVYSVLYLGFTIVAKPIFKVEFSGQIGKMFRSFHAIPSSGLRNLPLLFGRLAESYCLPNLTYGCEFNAFATALQNDNVCVAWNKIVRNIARFHSRSHVDISNLAIDTLPFVITRDSRTLNFACIVSDSTNAAVDYLSDIIRQRSTFWGEIRNIGSCCVKKTYAKSVHKKNLRHFWRVSVQLSKKHVGCFK